MWPLPIRNLLFLGKASEQKLLNQGIRTIGDLARERASNVQYWLGEKTGHQLWQYARGIDDSPVKAVPDEAKGFSVETTFNDDITSIEQVFPILLEQCDVLATRMRRKDKKCNCISVTFRTLDFRNRSHQTKLENATDLTDEIYINATRLFKEFWKGQPLRLIGVALTGSYEMVSEQFNLGMKNTVELLTEKNNLLNDSQKHSFHIILSLYFIGRKGTGGILWSDARRNIARHLRDFLFQPLQMLRLRYTAYG